MHKAVCEEGLPLRTRRRRGRRFCMGRAGKSSPNLPARDFEAEDPMAKPAADVAEFRVGGAKPRLSPVVDPCSDEVAACSISGPPNMKTVPETPAGLEGGLDGGDAPLPHSDMGRQHRVPAYRLALERTGIARSMSRKGSRLDNAKAENFFSTAKTELCYDWEGRPRCLREGSGEACRPVWQRAHQETPGRKRPGRVQAQPGRLIHFFCRSGNGVLCSFGAQLNSIGPFAS